MIPALLDLIDTVIWLDLLGCVVFCVPYWGPKAVFGELRPDSRASKLAARSYSLVDLMALMFVLACGNAFIARLKSELTLGWFVTVTIAINLLVLLFWVGCQRLLAAGGVTDPRRRFVMHAILYPAAMLLAAQVAAIGTYCLAEIVMRLSMIAQRPRSEWLDLILQLSSDRDLWRAGTSLLAAILLLPLCRWIFQRAILPARPAAP